MSKPIRRAERREMERGRDSDQDKRADRLAGRFHWKGRTYAFRGDRLVELEERRNYDGSVLVREVPLANFRLSIDRDYWIDADSPMPTQSMIDCTIHVDGGPKIPFTISAPDFYSNGRLIKALWNAAGRTLAVRACDISRIRIVTVQSRNREGE